MSEEMIYSIIDDIAHDAKVIISEHLHPELVKGITDHWLFRDIEDDVRAYFEKNHDRIVEQIKSAGSEDDRKEYGIGEEVYFISGGCAVKDTIKDVMLYTGSGKWLRLDEVFRSMDELVEHLKDNVHG